VPESVAANLRGRSFTIVAGIDVGDGDASGVLFSQGTLLGGHLLALVDGTVRYTCNWLGEDIQRVTAPVTLSPGRHVVAAERAVESRDDTGSTHGSVKLYLDDEQLAEATMRTQPGKFGLGSGLTVGRTLAPCADPEVPAPWSSTSAATSS
jgi:hypothetical protein